MERLTVEPLTDPATSAPQLEADRPSGASVFFWWLATVATLVVLDDLTFGPFFWLLARLTHAWVACLAIFAIYVPAQIYIVRRATEPVPGRFAAFFLRRLDLARKRPEISDNEQQLRRRVTGGASAVVSSLLIAGVLPPLLLWRLGFDVRFVRRISYLTATVYAAEFALLHGFLPSLF